MDTTTQQIQVLQEQLEKTKRDLDSISQQFYKNNFTSHQDFTKSCNFSDKIKLPVFTTLPTCEAGQVCVYSTAGTYKLMVATATNTWTIVGTQS